MLPLTRRCLSGFSIKSLAEKAAVVRHANAAARCVRVRASAWMSQCVTSSDYRCHCLMPTHAHAAGAGGWAEGAQRGLHMYGSDAAQSTLKHFVCVSTGFLLFLLISRLLDELFPKGSDPRATVLMSNTRARVADLRANVSKPLFLS